MRSKHECTDPSLRFASNSPTHGEQPGGSVVQANPPFADIPVAQSVNIDKILRLLPDAKMVPSILKDTIPANVSTSLPETPFIHVVQPNALGFVRIRWKEWASVPRHPPSALVNSLDGTGFPGGKYLSCAWTTKSRELG